VPNWKLLADAAREAAAYDISEGLIRRGSNEEVEARDAQAYLEETIFDLGRLVGVRLPKYRIVRGRAEDYQTFPGESKWKHLVDLALLYVELRENDLEDPREPSRMVHSTKEFSRQKSWIRGDAKAIDNAAKALGRLVGEKLGY
jgi:hypothetical protein